MGPPSDIELPENDVVLVGGGGFIGQELARTWSAQGRGVTIIDRRDPDPRMEGVARITADTLLDDFELPGGEVVLVIGNANPRPRWPWTLPLDIGLSVARLLPQLRARRVTLVSSVEIYGRASGPLTESVTPDLPWSIDRIQEWCDRAVRLAEEPVPPWRAASLCRDLVDADPSGRWVYAMAKLAQERLVELATPREPSILRLANVFGVGQERVLSRLVRRARAGLPLEVTAGVRRSFVDIHDLPRVLETAPIGVRNVGLPPILLEDLAAEVVRLVGSDSITRLRPAPSADSTGDVDASALTRDGILLTPMRDALPSLIEALDRPEPEPMRPNIPVVIPPRPVRPDIVMDRQQRALWDGCLKHGGPWTTRLTEQLRETLEVPQERRVLLTTSGTDALFLAIVATAGVAQDRPFAAVPSFTYPVTVDVLRRCGYRPRFVDVDVATWTIDPSALGPALSDGKVGLVVCVDAFGAPCDYSALRSVCDRAGLPLIADSAAALGARTGGRPVGVQADAHAFSMSFAKVVSAGGAGGAVVLPASADGGALRPWLHSSLMSELHAIPALDQLEVLEDLVRRRAEIASVYEEAASRLPLIVQETRAEDRHSFVHWVARVAGPGPQHVAGLLRAAGVESRRYFRPLHVAGRPLLPVTEMLDRQVLALPMSSELTVEDAEGVVTALERAFILDDVPSRSAAFQGPPGATTHSVAGRG